VLAVIQEKVNNPSPDDPFEPEIAAVRIWVLTVIDVNPNCFHSQLLKNDKAKFLATAKEYTKK
jgi:ubiquitin-conjugating enzyme E2 D/E